jgi:NAD(P)-dependent dehydrogenase (short-subunit alcohol dehydrogenase family)
MSSARGAVVVTGASTGIGEAAALRLDGLGFTVFAGVRKEADGKRVEEQASDRLRHVIIDVTDQATIDAAAKLVGDNLPEGGLVGLVNNAGIVVGAPLEFTPMEEIRRQFDVNLFGLIATTQTFLEMLRESRGRLVNIGSIGGKFASPFVGPYVASKFAIEAISDVLRFELKPWGIKVVLVDPGNITTPLWNKTLEEAQRKREELPNRERMEELYRDEIDAVIHLSKQQSTKGTPPSAVAKAIEKALLAAKPKTRYFVGPDAKVQKVVARYASDGFKDWMIKLLLNYAKKSAAKASSK